MHRLIVVAALTCLAVAACDASPESENKTGSMPSADATAAETATTCAHVVEVLAKTNTGDEAARKQVAADCEASLAEIADRHRRLTACILATGKVEEIEACEKPAQSYDPILRSLGPSDDEVCTHIMDILKREMGDMAPSEDDLAKGLEDCRKGMQKEVEKIGEQEFRKRAKCAMAARSMEDLMKCDPK